MDLRKGAAVDLRRGRAYLCVASEGRSTDRWGEAPQYFHHSGMPPPSPLDARVGGRGPQLALPSFMRRPPGEQRGQRGRGWRRWGLGRKGVGQRRGKGGGSVEEQRCERGAKA